MLMRVSTAFAILAGAATAREIQLGDLWLAYCMACAAVFFAIHPTLVRWKSESEVS